MQRKSLPVRLQIRLQSIGVFDIADRAGLCEDLVLVDDLRVFVDNLILENDVLADLCIGQDDAALDNRALADGDTAADNRIFHCAVDFAAVGDQGILDLCLIKELSRAGIGGSGVDRPVGGEQGCGLVDVDQSLVCSSPHLALTMLASV